LQREITKGVGYRREREPKRKQTRRQPPKTHLEKLGRTPIDTHAFPLVEISLEVLFRDAFGVTRVDESVEDVGDHVELGDGHLDLFVRVIVVIIVVIKVSVGEGEAGEILSESEIDLPVPG
jgi:hypothetical protein